MLEFTLPDMTCGHCVSSVTQALKQRDPAADVRIELDQHRVTVQSTLDRATLVDALTEAGYPPA